jgi:integrase
MVTWGGEIEAWTTAAVGASLSPKTIQLRRYYLARFASWCEVGPWDVIPDHVSEWLAVEDWAPETRKSARASVRVFYRWAIRTGRTVVDPTSGTEPIRTRHGVPRPTPELVLSDALERAEPRVRLMLLLAAYGGLRRAEIAGLAWEDISDGRMRITGKGGRVRWVPLHPRIYQTISTIRDTGPLFPGSDNGHLTPEHVGKLMSRALGGGWTAHTLRHRFGTALYSSSHDILQAQALLGHSSPATTQRYVAIPDDGMRDAVNAIV